MRKRSDFILRSFGELNLRSIVSVPIIAVYKSPSGYPGKYIARLWDVRNKPTQFVTVGDSLQEIRTSIPKGMRRLGPNSMDDPVIVETWI